jgi:competence protein ComEC
VNRLERLLLTHGDAQHVGGTRAVWEAFDVARTYTSRVSFRSTVYRELAEQLAATPDRHVAVSRTDKAGQWTVLHPAAEDKFSQADDACVVLQARFHKTRVLLLGDLGRPGQEALLRRHPYLDSDIVITGLPDKGEAVCDGLLASAHPKRLIVADSEFPATKRASKGFEQRMKTSGTRTVFTRKEGATTLSIRPEGASLRGMSGLD